MRTKPFNLKRALAGDKVITRGGEEVVKVIHFADDTKKENIIYFVRNADNGHIYAGYWVKKSGLVASHHMMSSDLLMLEDKINDSYLQKTRKLVSYYYHKIKGLLEK